MIGADLLVRALAAAGTRVLFNLSGNQIMPLYSGLVDAGISLVHTRHEAAAVHMADAYARLTERPCPVLITAGPGHANALGALYVAQQAESPVVLLSGHSELGNAGRGAFQEMDQAGLAARVAKAAWVVRDPSQLRLELARAYRVAASGRPGPVSLSLPADVLKAAIPGDAPDAPPNRAFLPVRRRPRVEDMARLVELLRGARRPLLLAGPAMARGVRWRAVQALAERLCMPALPMESPRGANDPSLGGVRTVFAQADLVVLIGRHADFSLGFGRAPLFAPDVRFVAIGSERLPGEPPAALWIKAEPLAVVESLSGGPHPLSPSPGGRGETHVEVLGQGPGSWQPTEGAAPPGPQGDGSRSPGAVPALRPARRGEQALSIAGGAVELPRGDAGWRAEVHAATRLGREGWDRIEGSSERPMHPLRMMAAARALLRDGDVFVGDGGEVGQWAQAGISRGGARVERVINGPSGAIGGAIPFAIGARFARAGARVLAVSGDGSIGWHLPELHTAVRHGLPLVVLVGNDGCWNAEVQIQRGLGGAPLDCLSLGDLRYDRAAEALGALGLRVDDPADLAPTLERAFASGRPALIDVAIRNEPAPTYTAGH